MTAKIASRIGISLDFCMGFMWETGTRAKLG
jgi:hypothetical protein